MSLTFAAVFEDGVFRPLGPINLMEGLQVEVTIRAPSITQTQVPRGFANRILLPEFIAIAPLPGDSTGEISADRDRG